MNVPKKFLKSNEIDQESLRNIKAFYAKYSSAYKSYIKNPLKGNQFKQAVIQWFFEQNKKCREQICAIENKWATLVIHQLYLHTLNQPKLRFILRDGSSIPFMDNIHLKQRGLNIAFHPDSTHFLHYFAMVSEKYDTSCNDEVIMAKFLKEIQFYHCEKNIIEFNADNLIEYGSFDKKDFYCYFKLSKRVLFNKTNFLSYFDVLSNERLFNKALGLTPQGIDYPDWIKQPIETNICFSLSEIIAALFEQVISSKFIIEKYGNGLFDITPHLSTCLKLKKDLKDFLIKQQVNDLYVYLHCEKITKSVYYNALIEKIIEAKTYNMNLKQRFTLYWENNSCLDKVISSVEKYLKSALNEKVFIERLLYRKIYQLYSHEDYYQRKVLALLSSYFDQSYNEELYNELMKPTVNENKNKKRKKKKKKGNVIQFDNVKDTDKGNKNSKEGFISINESSMISHCGIQTKHSTNNIEPNRIIDENTLIDNSKDTKLSVEMTKEIISKKIILDIVNILPIKNDNTNTTNELNSLNNTIVDSNNINRNSKQDENKSDTTSSEKDSNHLNQLSASITLLSLTDNNQTQALTQNQKEKKKKFFLYQTEPKKRKEPKKEKKAFISILNSDINKFEENVNQILSLISNIKQAVIAKVKSQIHSVIVLSHEIEIYGSYENGLSIESSDIDILVKFKKKINLINIMTHLFNYFTQSEQYMLANPISTATVPVIKLKVNPKTFLSDSTLLSELALFKETTYYREYLFENDELDYIKLDVTFGHFSKSVTKQQVDYIQKAIFDYPQIKPIIKIIKRILNLCNMNNSYTGGLSSYSIFLLVFAFQKSYVKPPFSNNYSHLLLDFLNCYSTFDYYSNVIDVTQEYPFVKALDNIETPPVIIDPITKLNAARSSFKILEVNIIFLKCITILNDIKLKYEEDKNDNSSDENSIKLLMKIIK